VRTELPAPVVAGLGGVPLGLLARSWRIETKGESAFAALLAAGSPYVLLSWHDALLPLLWRHRGRGITIVVSDGPPLVTVPSIRCMTKRQAADTLAASGLKITYSGSGTRVVDQQPGPDQQAPRGSTVTAFMGPGTYC